MADGTTIALSSVPVTATMINPDTPEHAGEYSTTTASNGTGTITGTNTQEGLVDGIYRIEASKTGYDDLTGTVGISDGQLVASRPPDALPIVGGRVSVSSVAPSCAQIQAVTVPVQLLSDDVAILPAGTITVRGNNIVRTCTLVTTAGVAACVPTQANTTVVNGTGPTDSLVAFGNLFPAVYTVTFDSTDKTYRSQIVQTQVFPGAVQPPVVLVLAAASSGLSGTVVQPGGPPNVAVAGAEVSLRFNANVETIVKDSDGNDLVTTTSATGGFTFSKVPDGPEYRLMVDAPGWYRIFSGVLHHELAVADPAADPAADHPDPAERARHADVDRGRGQPGRGSGDVQPGGQTPSPRALRPIPR